MYLIRTKNAQEYESQVTTNSGIKSSYDLTGRDEAERQKIQEFYNALEIDQNELIKNSSQIAILKFKNTKGQETKTVLTEILRKKNNFVDYKVGDIYPFGQYSSFAIEDNFRSEGAIQFLWGQPASVEIIVLYKDEIIPALNDLSIVELRSLIGKKHDS